MKKTQEKFIPEIPFRYVKEYDIKLSTFGWVPKLIQKPEYKLEWFDGDNWVSIPTSHESKFSESAQYWL